MNEKYLDKTIKICNKCNWCGYYLAICPNCNSADLEDISLSLEKRKKWIQEYYGERIPFKSRHSYKDENRFGGYDYHLHNIIVPDRNKEKDE